MSGYFVISPSPAFLNWVSQHAPEAVLLPLAGDASFRRYYRVQAGNISYIAMDASLEKSSCVPFVAIANAIRQHGLRSPCIFAEDVTQGFILLEDFGETLLLHRLNDDNAQFFYQKALDNLMILQSCREISGWALPLFTAEFMKQELQLFKEWFLCQYCEFTFSASREKELDQCFSFLSESAAAQPRVFMHRDYHSANLMILPNDDIGILDFQDAFIGPVTYDLVSLLRDCYISFSEETVKKCVSDYWEKWNGSVSLDEFMRWFDLMGLQRHLKALLTFSRKKLRDNNEQYLQFIPRTQQYIKTVSGRYPETKVLHALFSEQVLLPCVP